MIVIKNHIIIITIYPRIQKSRGAVHQPKPPGHRDDHHHYDVVGYQWEIMYIYACWWYWSWSEITMINICTLLSFMPSWLAISWRNIGYSNQSLLSIWNYILFQRKILRKLIQVRLYLGWPTPSSGIKDSDHLVLAVGGEQNSRSLPIGPLNNHHHHQRHHPHHCYHHHHPHNCHLSTTILCSSSPQTSKPPEPNPHDRPRSRHWSLPPSPKHWCWSWLRSSASPSSSWSSSSSC